MCLALPIFGDDFSSQSYDEDERDLVDDHENEFSGGSVPSKVEVQLVIHALQQIYGSSSHIQPISDHDEVENPTFSTYDRRGIQQHNASYMHYVVSQATDLWNTQPELQRMAESIASDRAVWNAFMNSEAARQLMESLSADTNEKLPWITTNIVSRILDAAKEKVWGVIEKIEEIVRKVFQLPNDAKGTGLPFNEKFMISLRLSIIVMLLVVVNRSYGA